MASKKRRSSVLVILLFVWTGVSAQDTSAAIDREFERATQLHQSGDLQGAVRAYLAILARSPARVDVRSNLGAAYSALGRYEDAIQEYKRALVIDGANYAIRFNLALAYYKAAWFSDAAAELERFVAAVPDSPQTANARLVLADCQVRLGEYKKVIDALSPLAEADANNKTLAYLLGSALIGDGQLDKGQAIIDRLFRRCFYHGRHWRIANALSEIDAADAIAFDRHGAYL